MNRNIILLLSMTFFHIIDDFYLQGILANLKQKSWWEEHASDKLYSHDYIMALLIHGFSWSVMIHIPAVIYRLYFNLALDNIMFFIWFIAMFLFHSFIDHQKANNHRINLIDDQIMHFFQILTTCLIYMHVK